MQPDAGPVAVEPEASLVLSGRQIEPGRYLVLLPQSRSAVIVFANSSSLFADHTREIAAGIVALLHGKPARTVARCRAARQRMDAGR